VWNIVADRNLGLIAAGVAYFGLLAVFPAVAALITLWGLLSDPAVIQNQMGLLAEFLPNEAYALVSEQVERLISANESTLGWATAISVLATLWSARLGLGAMIKGLNTVHGVANRSGFWHTVSALCLTVTMLSVGIVALASIAILPLIMAFVPHGGLSETVIEVTRWLVSMAVVMIGVSLLYRYGPNRRPRTSWISPGLVLAVLLWAIASVAFSWFLSNFGRYNEIYGSIGAVIALLIWLYISAYAVLAGAVLNTVIGPKRQNGHPEFIRKANKPLILLMRSCGFCHNRALRQALRD
jgi:membrane protein